MSWLQAVLLAPLVAAVPGFAIAAALFPPGTLPRSDRAIYSFVFSIGAAGLGGLLVQTVLGLDRWTWLGLLVAITLAAAAVARRRRAGLPIQHVAAGATRAPDGAIWAVAFFAAAAIAGVAIAVAVSGVREQQGRQRFASLWALPARRGRVQAGVWNHGGPARYTLSVSVRGRAIERLPLRLSPHERWRTTLGPAVFADAGAVQLVLYHGSAPYRSVELNIESLP